MSNRIITTAAEVSNACKSAIIGFGPLALINEKYEVGAEFLALVTDSAPTDLQMRREIMVQITSVKKQRTVLYTDGREEVTWTHGWKPKFPNELGFTHWPDWQVARNLEIEGSRS